MPGAHLPMFDLLFSPLGPGLLLVAAGLLLRVIVRVRRASVLLLLGLTPLALAFALLTFLRAAGVPELRIVWWPLVVPPLPVRWALDGWNWLSSLLLVLSGMIALLLTWRLPGLRTGAFHGLSLLLLGVAMIVVVSDNLLALSGAWVATDILLVARLRGSRPTGDVVTLGLAVAGSLLVLLAIGVASLSVATAPLATANLPAETLALLMLAAALRMAVYPFHLWAGPDSVQRDRGTRWLVAAVGLITGAWLLGRLYPLGVGYWLSQPFWPPLLALMLLGSGLSAWSASPAARIPLLGSNRAVWLWLLLALATPALGQVTLAYALLAVVLGLMLYVVGLTISQSWGWRLPLALSIGVLAGLPLLAGFPARALTRPDSLIVGLLLVVGDALAISCVVDAARHDGLSGDASPGQPSGKPMRPGLRLNWPVARLLLAFTIAAVPAILWGIQPEAVANLAGTVISSLDLGVWLGMASLGQWLALVLVLATSIALAGVLRLPEPRLHARRRQLADVTSLGWTVGIMQQGLGWMDNALRSGLAVLQGEGYFGWLILLALLAWLVVQL